MARSSTPTGASRVLMLAGIVIVVAALYFARDVLIPFALAVLFSFLLAPLVKRLERLGLGRIPSVLAVVLLASVLVSGLGWVVARQFVGLAGELPQYRANIRGKVQGLRGQPGGALKQAAASIEEIRKELSASQPAASAPATTVTVELPTDSTPGSSPPAHGPIAVEIVQPAQSPLDFIRENAGLFLGPLGTAGIVAVFVLFMLIERESLRDRLIRLMGETQLNITTQALDDATRRISRYLLMQLVVNATYGLPVAAGLWLIGVPGAFLWGFLCILLRFIPYVGPWIGAAMPLLLSVAVFERWLPTLEVLGMFVVIELISNNVIEPWLYGSSTGMSSLAILAAAVFWAWLWGPVGLLLATPLTVCLVVLGKYVPQLEFLNIMLGDQQVLDAPSRFYQRLLAMDAEEAADLADEYLEEESLLSVYDSIVIPALHMAERDRHRGRLDPERQDFIHQAMRDIVEELGERKQKREDDKAADPDDTSKPSADLRPPTAPVLCLPARDVADEIAALMLATVAQLEGLRAEAVSVTRLAGEMVEHVAAVNPYVVCISALPPLAATHARYLCKRLHARFPGVAVVVGLWNASGDLTRVAGRLGCDGQVKVVTRLSDALEHLRLALQSHDLKSNHQRTVDAAQIVTTRDEIVPAV